MGLNMVSLDRLMPLDDDMSAEEFSELVKLTRAHGEIDFSKVNPKAEYEKNKKTIHKDKGDDPTRQRLKKIFG